MKRASSKAIDAWFHSTGLPDPVIRNIRKTVDRWILTNGVEWTCARIKNFKILYVRRMAGLAIINSFWIRLASDGLPVDPGFRELFLMRRRSKKIWRALAVYTGFVASKPTRTQWRKFYDSVTSEPVEPVPFIPYLSEACNEVKSIFHPPISFGKVTDISYNLNRRSPDIKNERTVPESLDLVIEEIRCGYLHHIGITHSCELAQDLFLTTFRNLRELAAWEFVSDVPAKGRMQGFFDNSYLDDFWTPQYVGFISVIQEPGYKARWIANPHRIYQVIFHPLGRSLFQLLASLEWDCTFDQARGVEFAQKSLRKGTTVHSIDLSDASNHLPLSIQLGVLASLGVPDRILTLFQRVCRSKWKIPESLRKRLGEAIGPTPKYLRWSKGQPLGLYPSFPACFLTHGLIVRACELACGRRNTFRVLGDDIVIADDDVAGLYRKILHELAMPVAESKTIVSNRVAEFAGRVVTATSVYLSPKWKEVKRGSSPFYYATSYNEVPQTVEGLLGLVMRFRFGDMGPPIPVPEAARLLTPLVVEGRGQQGIVAERLSLERVFQTKSTSEYLKIFEGQPMSRREWDDLVLFQPPSVSGLADSECPKKKISGVLLRNHLIELFRMDRILVYPGDARCPDFFNTTKPLSHWFENEGRMRRDLSQRSILDFVKSYSRGQRKIMDLSHQQFHDYYVEALSIIVSDRWDIIPNHMRTAQMAEAAWKRLPDYQLVERKVFGIRD
jgi:hypothetical protein